jgi:ubiquinone/menaquinone biosynthesis C-methylase UbiE
MPPESIKNQEVLMTADTADPDITYHIKELQIASNPLDAHHVMPEFLDTDQAILDIGCGIGQTFVASTRRHAKLLVGLDINLKCLNYGHRQFDYIAYINGNAECLPFQAGSFDLLISRVSLPYTNIHQSLSEANRVLKNNGKVWFTLHPFSMTLKHLIRSMRNLEVKDVIYRCYVLVNGSIFHFFGKQFPFIFKKRYESFQTDTAMYRAMQQAGFKDIFVERKGGQFICTGRKPA